VTSKGSRTMMPSERKKERERFLICVKEHTSDSSDSRMNPKMLVWEGQKNVLEWGHGVSC
jgi:hypothetical protein